MDQARLTPRLCVLVLLLAVAPAKAQPATQPTAGPALQRIAFGSCSDPRKPVPAFLAITRAKPDLMIFVGDNVYADTTDERELRRAYQTLGENPGFRRIKDTCPILATWDDHDYGINDGGAEHPNKAGSQRAFMDFWGVPKDSPRRTRQGVYHAQMFGPEGQRVQVILLDTRYHRGPLTRRPKNDSSRYAGRYLPNPDPSVTMLGEAQWAWLQEQLEKPADLRLIVSSIQFVAEDHGWETWAMLPAERTRLIELIRSTNANGVVILSGDRHHSELSRLDQDAPYPIYDLTSSGLNKPGLEKDEPNRHRVGQRYPLSNFGLITLDWNRPSPAITLQIIDPQNNVHIEHRVTLDELAPPR
jgi:alkaline phosphatase D